MDVLASFGEVFVDVVCRDAVSGHDVRRMLALSLLVWCFFDMFLKDIKEYLILGYSFIARRRGWALWFMALVHVQARLPKAYY